MADGNPTEGLVTARGLAEFLGCSVRTVYRLIAQGLPHLRLGLGERSPYRFQPTDVLEWLEATSPSGPERSQDRHEDRATIFSDRRTFIR